MMYANATESASGVEACASSLSIVPYVGSTVRHGRDDGASAFATKARERRRRKRREHLCYDGNFDVDDDDDEDDDSDVNTSVSCLNKNPAAATAMMGDGIFGLVKMGKYEEYLRCIDVREDLHLSHLFVTRSPPTPD